jgi:hypothetical protein
MVDPLFVRCPGTVVVALAQVKLQAGRWPATPPQQLQSAVSQDRWSQHLPCRLSGPHERSTSFALGAPPFGMLGAVQNPRRD